MTYHENAEARGASNHEPEGVTVSRSEGAAPRADAYMMPIAYPDECPIVIQRIVSLYDVIATETSGYVTAHIAKVPRSLVEQVPARELCVAHGDRRFSWTRLVWLYGLTRPRQMLTLSTDEPPVGWVMPECCAECGAELTHDVAFYADEKNLCRACTAEGPV